MRFWLARASLVTFWTCLTLYVPYSPISFLPTLATTSTPTGTPSSGLDSQAWQESTPFRRSSNSSSSRSLPPHSSHLKPSSFGTGKIPTTFYVGMPVIGNPLFALTAIHPLSIKALYLVSTAEPHPRPSNLPSTTPSRQLTQTHSALMQTTTPSVWNIPITSHHHHRSRNNNVSIASCAISLIPVPTDPPLSHHLPFYHEHPSHDLSSLVQEVFSSGLV